MNIKRQFVDYLVAEGFGTFGTDIFIGTVPQGAPDTALWILSSGGNTKSKNKTGENQKNYLLSVFYRSLDASQVDEKLEQLETLINRNNCIDISGYDIIETEATVYPSDQDIDNEDRTVGLIQINLTVYL